MCHKKKTSHKVLSVIKLQWGKLSQIKELEENIGTENVRILFLVNNL